MFNPKGIFKMFFINNFGLKMIALFLATLAWFYVLGELGKVTIIEDSVPFSPYYPFRMKAKRVDIMPVFEGNPPAGYAFDERHVKMNPKTCMIVGPTKVLEKLENVKTAPIDLTEYTKSFKEKVALQSVPNLRLPEEDFISVSIPITKKE